MSIRRPDPDLEAELEAMAARFEAEDREDCRIAAQERREDKERAARGLPPKKRPRPKIRTYGFTDTAVTPRD